MSNPLTWIFRSLNYGDFKNNSYSKLCHWKILSFLYIYKVLVFQIIMFSREKALWSMNIYKGFCSIPLLKCHSIASAKIQVNWSGEESHSKMKLFSELSHTSQWLYFTPWINPNEHKKSLSIANFSLRQFHSICILWFYCRIRTLNY